VIYAMGLILRVWLSAVTLIVVKTIIPSWNGYEVLDSGGVRGLRKSKCLEPMEGSFPSTMQR
jgi:hypothetical protein